MADYPRLYIDGTWREPVNGTLAEVRNPATGAVEGRIALGGAADVNLAVAAANRALATWSQTTVEERVDLLQRVAEEYRRRGDDLAEAITIELGCPREHSLTTHVYAGILQFEKAVEVLQKFPFSEQRGNGEVRREPIGVAGLITPWNFPALQPAGKVASALAAGCTVVLKPAQLAALSGIVLAEIMDAAGVPAGVFNLVNGKGSEVGKAMSEHPDIATISLTGSLAAAVSITTASAPTVKRITTELGGKSPQIVMPDADMSIAADTVMTWMMANSGQTCSAPSRAIVPRGRVDEFLQAVLPRVRALKIGDPREPGITMGPMVSDEQYRTVQHYIGLGLEAGARLVTGGLGKPEGLEAGHFAQPTIFTGVTNDMVIAQEEIFGPVMCVIAYDTVEQAIAIANDTPFGLAGYVTGQDVAAARAAAERIRAGYIVVNNAVFDWTLPWGGYKQSGNGREWGAEGMSEYLETKVILGA